MPLLAVIFVTEFIYYAVPDVISLSTQFQRYGNVRQLKNQLLTHLSLDVFCWLCACVLRCVVQGAKQPTLLKTLHPKLSAIQHQLKGPVSTIDELRIAICRALKMHKDGLALLKDDKDARAAVDETIDNLAVFSMVCQGGM